MEGFIESELWTSRKVSRLEIQENAYSLLMVSLLPFWIKPIRVAIHSGESSSTKQWVRVFGFEQKWRLDDGADLGNAVELSEVQVFLQFKATFGIVADLSSIDLCKDILTISKHGQNPKLCGGS